VDIPWYISGDGIQSHGFRSIESIFPIGRNNSLVVNTASEDFKSGVVERE